MAIKILYEIEADKLDPFIVLRFLNQCLSRKKLTVNIDYKYFDIGFVKVLRSLFFFVTNGE